MLGKIESKKRKGCQRMRQLDGITNSMDMSLSNLQETVKEQGWLASSTLAWRIPGTGEPGGLLSMGSHRVRHPGRSRLRECGRRDWRLAGLSSALAFPLDLGARPLCRRLRAGGVQTANASRKQSSLSGKESAQGCIPQRLLGRPDEALGGGSRAISSSHLQLEWKTGLPWANRRG